MIQTYIETYDWAYRPKDRFRILSKTEEEATDYTKHFMHRGYVMHFSPQYIKQYTWKTVIICHL